MISLQLTRLEAKDIPNVLIPIKDGENYFQQDDYAVEFELHGERLYLVFDVEYEEWFAKIGNGITTEERIVNGGKSIKAENLRLEDDHGNQLELENREEIQKELSSKKIGRG